jgi:DNA-binding NarL/FixJ family response regulator
MTVVKILQNLSSFVEIRVCILAPFEPMSIKILLADDHAVVRHGISLIIKDFLPASEIIHAHDFPFLLEQLKVHEADLVICDINMPGCDSFHIISAIRDIQPDIKILIFSAYPEDLYATRYIQEGANGYLHKDADTETIKSAITTVLKKGRFISDHLLEKYLQGDGLATKGGNPLKSLSNREMEVALLMTQGLGLLEMSNALKLHISTVSTYKTRVFEKLNISNIPELLVVFKNYATTEKN